MKKTRLIAFVLSIMSVVLMVGHSFAAEVRASDQISIYAMDVYTGDGTLDIEFYIGGKGIMDKIGCESIYLYKKINGEWSYVTRLLENYTGMSVTESGSHANMISIGCNDGVEYKIVVTLFSENSAGRDTRSDTFYVTGQSN